MVDLTSKYAQSKAVCPHCWHEFYSDEAMFISRHMEFYGDPLLLDPSENRRFAPHEITRDGEGNALDPKGWTMNERACPRCHLQIPIELLSSRPFILSVVGAPQSGKTYFLASMIHNLRKDLAKYFAMSLQDSDSHDVKAFQQYEQTLFYPADSTKLTILRKTDEVGALYNIVRLDNVDVQLPKPFIFTLRATEAHPDWNAPGKRLNRNLVLYDNAGESFNFLYEKGANIRVTQHLSQCDSVVFAFDPLQFPEARLRLVGMSRDPQLTRAAHSHRQETVLLEAVNRMRRHRNVPPGQRLPVPLLVCLQKYDVWKSLVPHAKDPATGAERIDPSSIMFFKSHGIAGLDVDELNLISLLLRSFISDLCPEFVAQAEANFEVVRFFAISALGTSPQYDEAAAASGATTDNLKVRPMDLCPFRVTDPLLWLLHRWKLIYRTRSRYETASEYPLAPVEVLPSGRLRVTSPLTNRVMTLDREYAGSTILDPDLGRPVKVASLPEGAKRAEPAPPPVTVDKPPVSPLKLKKNESPKPPKRGWF